MGGFKVQPGEVTIAERLTPAQRKLLLDIGDAGRLEVHGHARRVARRLAALGLAGSRAGIGLVFGLTELGRRVKLELKRRAAPEAPESKADQSELTQRRRLSQGRCPIHGLGLVQTGTRDDGMIVECPRRDCAFQALDKGERYRVLRMRKGEA